MKKLVSALLVVSFAFALSALPAPAEDQETVVIRDTVRQPPLKFAKKHVVRSGPVEPRIPPINILPKPDSTSQGLSPAAALAGSEPGAMLSLSGGFGHASSEEQQARRAIRQLIRDLF